MSRIPSKLAALMILIIFLPACKSTYDPRETSSVDLTYTAPTSEQESVEKILEVDPKAFIRIETLEQNTAFNQQQFTIERYKRGDEYLDKIILPSNLLFASNVSKLSPETKHALDKLVNNYQDAMAQQFIYIVGHTDSDGDSAYNIGLSTRRAVNVAKILGKYQLPNERMLIIPAGEHLPAVANTSRKNKAINRRVELFLANSSTLTLDYIRQQSCPEQLCQYAEVSILEVNRRFELKVARANLNIPRTVVTMEEEYESKRNQVSTTIRKANFYTIEVRPKLEFKIQSRQISNLPAKYHIRSDDTTRVRISERM